MLVVINIEAPTILAMFTSLLLHIYISLVIALLYKGSLINNIYIKIYVYSTNLWWVLSSLVTFYWITRVTAVSSLHLANWMQLDLICTSWDFKADSLAGIILLVIAVTSGIVSSYSLDYMYADAH